MPSLDTTVRRRFAELAAKAERLAAAGERSDSGVCTIPAAPFYAWVTNVQNLFARTFGGESLHYRNFVRLANRFTSYEAEFASCRAVFLAAREDYEGGYLFNVRAAAKAEALADALAQARQLLAAGAKEPACVLAQVALEVTLKELAGEHGIKRGRLQSMNAALGRAGVYHVARQQQISTWAAVGSKAIKGRSDAYDEGVARALLEGAEQLVAEFL
jgi:HEPN domain-containing protein